MSSETTPDTAHSGGTNAPFQQYALTLFDNRLGEIFPIRPETKKPVNWDKPADAWEWGDRTPDGKRHSVTARNHPPISRKRVEQWAEEFPDHMLGLVPAPTVVVVDIDQHDDKHGAESLAKALGISRKELGLLLKRTLHVSARETGSGWEPAHGHWYFAVPEDIRLKRNPVKDVDIIGPGRQGFYVVAPGSVHPATGRTYAADVAGVERSMEWLSVDLVQPMPQPLLDLLRDDQERAERPADGGLVDEAMEHANDPWGTPDEAVAEVLTTFFDDPGDYADAGSHHGSALRVQIDLVHLAEEGHPGVWTALSEAAEVAEGYFEAEDRGGEWDRLLEGVSVDVDRMVWGAKTGDFSYSAPVSLLRGPDGQPIQSIAQRAYAEQAQVAAVEAARPAIERFPLLDISVLDPNRPPRRWLLEGVVPEGDSVSIVAPGGTGKSLFSLALTIAAVRGQTEFVGKRIAFPTGGKVLYIDMENSEDDWAERLASLGVTLDEARSFWGVSFFPLSLPALAGLDTESGAKQLREILDAYGFGPGDLVILDSMQRVTEGPENDADTFRNLYNYTAVELKRRGLTVLRTDNTGWEKGRVRGSSSKRDDVAYSWYLEPISEGSEVFTLTNAKTRAATASGTVRFRRATDHSTGLLSFEPVLVSVEEPRTGQTRERFKIAATEVLKREFDRAEKEGTKASLSQSKLLKAIRAEQIDGQPVTFRNDSNVYAPWLGELVEDGYLNAEQSGQSQHYTWARSYVGDASILGDLVDNPDDGDAAY